MSDTPTPQKPLSYRDAGVDIDAGDALIGAIAPHAARTRRPGADAGLGGFGGLFDLRAAGFNDPVLVAATDGVGTKLELARQVGLYRGLGIDLVAMCVNDIMAQGAIPLFFLDYFATGKLDPGIATDIVAGIADGCVDCECALIGGETAEMPGVYPAGGFDIAGFSVGAGERGALLSAEMPSAGDVAIALPSSGVHSNGYSLVRRVIEVSAAELDQPFADSGTTLGAALMTPTRIYHHATRTAHAAGTVNGVCHVTGGGLVENPPRIFADDLALRLDCSSWHLPPIFSWLREQGRIEMTEMLRTFNCGIGMLLLTPAEDAAAILHALQDGPEPDAWITGTLQPRVDGPSVIFDQLDRLDAAW